ncbi:helix-turn-helix domain-containing protein [Variovorax sp. KK3]|uniref:helix-turn-helix domain-containing protein n=1 Tax=Variovorax sp. KK3 TaxID=1855728 RepID=UPI00211842A4|nr:helix-turn-helix domain-containing protein [Variovorax sp. KK3]
MTVIKDIKWLMFDNTDMKYDETPLLSFESLADAATLGGKLARLRKARRLRQQDAAELAGISRSTAVLIEQGDPGRTLAQLLRYLHAIAPGQTLLDLMLDKDPSLQALSEREATKRVRRLSDAELRQLDF